MNDLKSAAKLSLEALQNAWLDASMGKGDVYRHNEAIKALKEALAKQEQCKYPNCDYPCMNLPDCHEQEQHLQALHDENVRLGLYEQQQRKPLTDEQMTEIYLQNHAAWQEFARAIEAAHGIKE